MPEMTIREKVEWINEQVRIALQDEDPEKADRAAVLAFRAMRKLELGFECLEPEYPDGFFDQSKDKQAGVQ